MALVETWLRQNLKEPVKAHYMNGVVFTQDNMANLIGVEVFDENVQASLSGTLSANVIRADHTTVAVDNGVIDGNRCYVTLPQAAYAVPGAVSIVLKLASGDAVTTLALVISNVYQSVTSVIIDPGTIIPSIQTLIADIEEAVDSIPLDWSELNQQFEGLKDALFSVSNVNLFPFAEITTGYYINASGVETAGNGFACTEIINVNPEPGVYDFSATAEARSTSWTLRLHAYKDGVWQRQIDTISVTKNGGSISKRITLQEGENGVRVSYVDVLSNQVIQATDAPTAIDRTVRGSLNSLIEESTIPKSVSSYISNNSLCLADIYVPGYYPISDSSIVTDGPTGETFSGVLVEKLTTILGNDHFVRQTVFSSTLTGTKIFERHSNASGTYSPWDRIVSDTYLNDVLGVLAQYEKNKGVSDLPESCDDIDSNSIIFVSVSGGQTTVPDFPISAAGWLRTILVGTGSGSKAAFQIVYPYTPSNSSILVRRKSVTQVWSDWVPVGAGGGGGGDVTYNITQNINRDEFNNSYTITASPQITTDSHGWLAAVDNESTSQANATDMTSAIMTLLNSTGYCHLGEGTFYVSGNITMPAGSTLEGCGGKSIVRLLNSVTSGFIVQPTERCSIRNIQFDGGTSAPSDLNTQDAENLGSRHGVYLVANANGSTSHGTVSGAHNILDGCIFRYFNGSAIYMANTGGGVTGCLSVSDVSIRECMVGINIDYYSEYNKFANVIIYRCNHACINNGGNNVFVGCTFGGVVGFVIDNSGSDKRNNAHGTCSACTYNHIDSVNRPGTAGGGNAVVIKGADNGFIFTGCQFWYGEILVENSRGISFTGCLIGGGTPSITVSGSYPAFFSDCIFHQTPAISVVSGTKFSNCYLDSNGNPINP